MIMIMIYLFTLDAAPEEFTYNKIDYFDKSQVDVLPDSVYGFTSALVVIVFPM